VRISIPLLDIFLQSYTITLEEVTNIKCSPNRTTEEKRNDEKLK
jgi:hypothetical protein